MAGRVGGRPPFGTVSALIGFTRRGSEIAPYVRGRLALAGMSAQSREPVSTYLDAIYAIVAEAPYDVLKELAKQLTLASARIAPDRDTWGLEPEHQAMMGGMVARP